MKKIFLLSLLIIISTTILSAQAKKGGKKDEITKSKTAAKSFVGKLKKMPWSKSVQSYCAQGSEYYVLLASDDLELVIQNNSKTDLSTFENQQVKITGKLETKTITADPMEQRPISPSLDGKDDGTYKCTVLAMSKIEKIK